MFSQKTFMKFRKCFSKIDTKNIEKRQTTEQTSRGRAGKAPEFRCAMRRTATAQGNCIPLVLPSSVNFGPTSLKLGLRVREKECTKQTSWSSKRGIDRWGASTATLAQCQEWCRYASQCSFCKCRGCSMCQTCESAIEGDSSFAGCEDW